MIERIFKKDLWAKIAVIALAVLTWYRVISKANPLEVRNVDVGLQISSAPGKVVTAQSPDRVKITLQGRASSLDKLDARKLSIPVDVSSLEVGSNKVPLAFPAPAGGVRVIDINPKVVIISLDVEESKSVSVVIHTRGMPNEEYEAQAPVPETATASVSGPRAQVEKVSAVLGFLDITGATGNVHGKEVVVTAVDAQTREVAGVHVKPAAIAVSVPMKAKPPAKTVAVRAETTGSPQAGYRVKSVRAEPGSVKVRGETSVTSRISSIASRAVDVSGRSETFTYQASLVIPQGVTAEFQRVNVTVEMEEDTVKATFKNVIVQVESLPAGFKWQVNPQTVDVTIEGRRDVVESINGMNVQAVIDASWVKGAGSHKIVVNVRGLPDSVRFDAIVPSQVILELKTR